MKIPFKVLTMAVAGSFLLTAAVTVTSAQNNQKEEAGINMAAVSKDLAVEGVNVAAKEFKESTELYSVTMNIPVVEGMKDKAFEKNLNEEIEKKVMTRYEQLKQEAKEGLKEAKEGGFEFHPYMLDVSYKIKSAGGSNDGGKLSIVIESYVYFGGAHGTLFLDTYNVMNKKEATLITLKQLLGDDYKKKANEAIKKAMKHHPEKFFPEAINEFETISDDQPFYIEKGNAVLVFQPGELSPHPVGVMEIDVR